MSGLLAGKVWLSALAPHLKPLAATLADIGNDDGSSIYPSVAYVAWRLGRSERQVQMGLGELRDLAVLVVVDNEVGGRSKTVEYLLDEVALPKREPWNAKGEGVAPFAIVKGATKVRKGRNLRQRMGATSSAKGRNERQERVKQAAPEPLVNPLEEPLDLDPLADPSARERAEMLVAAALSNRPFSFSLYENLFGLMNSAAHDKLLELEATYPADWIVKAFDDAKKYHARSVGYVMACLARWASEGMPRAKGGKEPEAGSARAHLLSRFEQAKGA